MRNSLSREGIFMLQKRWSRLILWQSCIKNYTPERCQDSLIFAFSKIATIGHQASRRQAKTDRRTERKGSSWQKKVEVSLLYDAVGKWRFPCINQTTTRISTIVERNQILRGYEGKCHIWLLRSFSSLEVLLLPLLKNPNLAGSFVGTLVTVPCCALVFC